MADEVVDTASLDKTKRVVSEVTPKGSIARNYGVPVGVAGLLAFVLQFLGSKPEQAFKILAQFGPKWVFWTVISVLIWDVIKRLLKLAGRAVAHIGELAANTGRAADGVQAFAAKSDRAAEEQARLTAFAVQTSQRAVELGSETLAETKRNSELLQQLTGAKQVSGA